MPLQHGRQIFVLVLNQQEDVLRSVIEGILFTDRRTSQDDLDGARRLTRLASVHCGLSVSVLRVQDLNERARFDGVWACASLLHVPLQELPDVFQRLAIALKPGGILYASFKYGQGEREHRGRRFTDLDEIGLADLLHAAPYFTVLETWITADRRPERAEEQWLNLLLKAQTPGPTGNSGRCARR